MLLVQLLNNGTPNHVGIIPQMLDADNPQSAAEQFDRNYQHGGGWRPMKPNKWQFNPQSLELTYPGDDPYKAKAGFSFREEQIYIYDHAWVCIVQPDGSFEVSRMD